MSMLVIDDVQGGGKLGITIKDLAKLANVSHTTVSRALNDSPLIHKDTKRKIKALAKEMNYIPNINAKSLVLHRSYNIGLFFSTLKEGTSAAFLRDVVRGVNDIVKDRYNIIVKGIDDYDHHFQAITRRAFDGIIVMSQSASDNAFIEYVMAQNIPQVVLNRRVEYSGVSNILSDDYQGVFKMCEHMIEQGHRHIALIEGREGFQSTVERSRGYTDALRKHGLAVKPSYRVKGNYDVESGYTAMRRLLQLPEQPTAVFCSNDEMAVGAIKAVQEHGLSIPDDISIAGFDDNVFSAFLNPALTTVKRPIEQLSQEGAKKLVQLLEVQTPTTAPSQKDDTVYMNTDIIIRESVRKI